MPFLGAKFSLADVFAASYMDIIRTAPSRLRHQLGASLCWTPCPQALASCAIPGRQKALSGNCQALFCHVACVGWTAGYRVDDCRCVNENGPGNTASPLSSAFTETERFGRQAC